MTILQCLSLAIFIFLYHGFGGVLMNIYGALQLNAQHEMKYCAAWGLFAVRHKSKSTYCPLHTNGSTTSLDLQATSICCSIQVWGHKFMYICMHIVSAARATSGTFLFSSFSQFIMISHVFDTQVQWGSAELVKYTVAHVLFSQFLQNCFFFHNCMFVAWQSPHSLCTKMDAVHGHYEHSIIFQLH